MWDASSPLLNLLSSRIHLEIGFYTLTITIHAQFYSIL
jgi:hypothetical protein